MRHRRAISLYRVFFVGLFLIALSFLIVLVLGGLQVYARAEAVAGFDCQRLINDSLPK